MPEWSPPPRSRRSKTPALSPMPDLAHLSDRPGVWSKLDDTFPDPTVTDHWVYDTTSIEMRIHPVDPKDLAAGFQVWARQRKDRIGG